MRSAGKSVIREEFVDGAKARGETGCKFQVEGEDGMDDLSRRYMKELTDFHERLHRLYQEADWIKRHDYPAIDSLTEEMWAQMYGGKRHPLSEPPGSGGTAVLS